MKEFSNGVAYKECTLSVPVGRDLLDLSVQEISRFCQEVVEAEGPIHTEEVARRIREAFRLQRSGARILAHVTEGLRYLARKSILSKEGEFWLIAGQNASAIRGRRTAPLPLRRAKMISPAEYRLAILTVISEAVTISLDELVIETARLFGFDRTGPDLKDAISREVQKLKRGGQLIADVNGLQIPACVAQSSDVTLN